jgi:hypothetical protein
MKDDKLITSVMGFDLTCNVVDENGKPITKGIGSTVDRVKSKLVLKNRMINKKFWTNYNEGLLNKILDYRRNND